MRVAWFTPFSQKSAIGLYSKYACEALQENCDIRIYTPTTDKIHQTVVPVKHFDTVSDIPWDELDLCFYNIGDNSIFHSQIVDCLLQHPGIVILHDLSILNLWIGYYIVHRNNPAELRKSLEAHYGADGANEIVGAMSDAKIWSQLDFQRYSGLELILPYAKGILVHSNYHKAFVRKSFRGPLKVAYFPFPSDRSGPKKIGQRKTVQLLTVGHVNPNKCIAQVIEALGRDKQLSKRINYIIAGGLENEAYAAHLKGLIERYQLQDQILLNGYTTNEELEDFYQSADILINLRNPALEGASWSLAEQMYFGKPIIVSNTGFYGEMPSDCVYPISTDHAQEIEEIQKALLWMLDHWDQAQEMGKNAYHHAKKIFSPKQYAKDVIEFIDIQAFQLPIEQLIDYVCYEFNAIGIDSSMEICKKYSSEIESLFFQPTGQVNVGDNKE